MAIKFHKMGNIKHIKKGPTTSLVKNSSGLIVPSSQHAKRILPKEPRPKTSEGSKSIRPHHKMDSVTLCTENSKSHGITSKEVPAGAKSRDF
jgi:hypothetical protein